VKLEEKIGDLEGGRKGGGAAELGAEVHVQVQV
jgi:hypothetical protein